jgi:hypothetical protein
MGYEVKLFVGRPTSVKHCMDEAPEQQESAWFSVYVEIELFKPGYDSEICALSGKERSDEGTPIYMYGLDGNTQFVEDRYGKRLRTLPMPQVLTALEKDLENSKADYPDGYWPFRAAADVLRSAIQYHPEMQVVLYGH